MNSLLQKCFVIFVVFSLTISQVMPVSAETQGNKTGSTSTTTDIETVSSENKQIQIPIVKLTNDATALNPLEQEISTEFDIKEPIEIKLSITPEILEIAGDVIIEWAISGISEKEINGFVLEIILPDNFEPVTEEKVAFDKSTISIPITTLIGSIKVRTKIAPSSDVFFSANLLDLNKNLVAFADLILPFKTEYEIKGQVDEIYDEEKGLKVIFDENIVRDYPKGLEIEIGTPTDIEAIQTSFSGQPFEIEAKEKSKQTEVEAFDDPVEFQVNLDEYGYSDAQDGELLIYWYNPDTQEWEGMVSWIDQKTNTLHSETNHFSIFDVGSNNWEASKIPSVSAFQVSNFTGAATYSVPIEVPAGPGGLQPSLTLSYNSQIIDQSVRGAQPGWVGKGWSLDTGYIQINTQNTSTTADDTRFLHINGLSTEIISTSSGYRTSDENFMKISYSGGIWKLWDKQGNVYEFAQTTTMRYSTGRNCSPEGETSLSAQTNRWSLTTITDKFGNELIYSYVKETKNIKYYAYSEPYSECRLYGVASTDTATYPSTIKYSDNKIRIRFVRETRTDYNSAYVTDDVHHSFERTRLSEIIIEQDFDGDGTFESILKKYDLTYSTDSNVSLVGRKDVLFSIQEFGVSGATALPATTFTYGDSMHLTKAENGYGGVITFAYEYWRDDDTRNSYKYNWSHFQTEEELPLMIPAGGWGSLPNTTKIPVKTGSVYRMNANIDTGKLLKLRVYNGSTYQYLPTANDPIGFIYLPFTATSASAQFVSAYSSGGPNTFLYGSSFHLYTTIYRVTTKTIQDGNGNSYTYTYTYTDAAMNKNSNSVSATNGTAFGEKYSEFRGHATVTEIGPDGVETITYYHQDDVYKGRAYKTQVKVNGVLRSETLYEYANTALSGFTYGGKTVPRNWTTLTSTENRIYDNNGTSYNATRTVYTYESTYGNMLTQTQQSWNGSSWVNYLTQSTEYWFNDSATGYLVSFPARTQVLDANSNVLAETLYLYDGNTGSYQTMPTDGKLTAVRTLIQNGTDYSQISYAYDAWGNQTSQTTWSGYGTWNTSPSTGARTSTTVFDALFHTYPISTTTPATPNAPQGLTTQWNYDYDNNGIDDFILGIPTKQIDPNGNQIEVRYDAFGRIIKLIRPEDSESSPTMSFSYNSAFPFTTVLIQKINASDSYTVIKKYDGMGRQFYVNTGGTIVDTVYQSPTVTLQSTPYTTGESVYYTTSTINPSANTSTVTVPDGNSTTTFINGLSTTVTDPNGNVTSTTKDVWGRVILVTPPTGPAVGYTYDELNRMLTATRAGNATQINYDIAGRKISMDDPDMGNWFYEYDALGNLIKQTDAKNQVICLFYDNLNRLNGKTYPANGSCGTPVSFATEFNYDENTNGLGRRTSMEDESGNTSWNYDARGRVISESKVISGQSFSTSWSYNSADLPIMMTYPDNEILTYSYNSRILLNSVSSSLGGTTYVNSSDYDSAGRLTNRVLGNNLTQTHNYYDWNEQFSNIGQGGRLENMTIGSIQNLNYVYDKNGNILNINDVVTSEVQTFGYDTLNRLTSATVTNGLAPYSESYSYDSSTGNLASKNGINYSYNDSNHVHAATSLSNGNSYTYDANGNMIDRTVNGQNFDLAYDVENRLIAVESASLLANNGSELPNSTTANPHLAKPVFQSGDTPTPTETLTPTPTETPSPTPTATPQTYTLTLQPNGTDGIDTYIRNSSAANTNYGTSVDLGIGESNSATNIYHRALIKFDLSSLPSNAVITSAMLSIYPSNDFASSDGLVSVYRLKVPFVENQATWNISATGVNWQTAGANGENDRELTPIGSVTVAHNEVLGTEKVIALDSSKIQEMINGTFSNNGFFLKTDAELNDHFYYKTSDSAQTTQRPKLVIQYTLSPYTATPSLTPSISPTPTPTFTSTLTPTPTGPTSTLTKTSTPTVTLTPSNTSTSTITPTFTPTLTFTPSNTPTLTLTPTFTSTPTITPTPQTPIFSNATFVYDGDGKRVKSVLINNIGSTTTYFAGSHYEVTNGVITKYYFAGSQRIAMRENGVLSFVISDHLGSTSIVTDASGNVISNTKYKAWGEIRYSSGTNPSEYTYTGQYSYVNDFGLMFYNARFYDPQLGRFSSADSIVPAGIQGLDRYAYTFNNPIRYVDPSGHISHDCSEIGYCRVVQNLSLPTELERSYTAGKSFFEMLENEDGYWSSYVNSGDVQTQINFVIKTIIDLEGYSLTSDCQVSDSLCAFQQGITEAITRKIYDFYYKYGTDGLYVGVGSYEAIRTRVDLYYGTNNYGKNDDLLQKTADYLMTPFFPDRVDSVLQKYYLSSWTLGALGSRPYDIGNKSMAYQWNSESMIKAVVQPNIGPSSNQIFYLSPDGLALILTLDQTICHDPNRKICQ